MKNRDNKIRELQKQSESEKNIQHSYIAFPLPLFLEIHFSLSLFRDCY
jgi:hypothetical protein